MKITLTSEHIPKTISFREGAWITYSTCRISFDSLKHITDECFKKGALTKIYPNAVVINYDTIAMKELTYLGKRHNIYPVHDRRKSSWKITVVEP